MMADTGTTPPDPVKPPEPEPTPMRFVGHCWRPDCTNDLIRAGMRPLLRGVYREDLTPAENADRFIRHWRRATRPLMRRAPRVVCPQRWAVYQDEDGTEHSSLRDAASRTAELDKLRAFHDRINATVDCPTIMLDEVRLRGGGAEGAEVRQKISEELAVALPGVAIGCFAATQAIGDVICPAFYTSDIDSNMAALKAAIARVEAGEFAACRPWLLCPHARTHADFGYFFDLIGSAIDAGVREFLFWSDNETTPAEWSVLWRALVALDLAEATGA